MSSELAPLVYIVDDDPSFRQAVSDLLRASGYRVVPYESAMQLLNDPVRDQPACILLDVQMAGLSGPELQCALAKRGSILPIIFVTGHGDIPTSVQTIKAGAEDFLTKPVTKDRLLGTIERALGRYTERRNQHDKISALRLSFEELTGRQRQVFELLVRGKPHKQIAFELGTSDRTVKAHRHKIMTKFHARSLAELAVFAERLGILAGVDGVNPKRSSTNRTT